MKERKRGDLSPDFLRDDTNITGDEKSRQRADMEAAGATRPHFTSLEDVHAYHQTLDRAQELEQTPTLKSLADYRRHFEKAQEAVKTVPEGLRASMDLGYIPNRLELSDGAYNPKFINWLEVYLTDAALALNEILSYDDMEGDNKGYIAVWKERAGELIHDMQCSVSRFKDDAYSLTYALEYYNYLVAYMEERGLTEDFDNYVDRLWLAK